jgi:hypothetical protein
MAPLEHLPCVLCLSHSDTLAAWYLPIHRAYIYRAFTRSTLPLDAYHWVLLYVDIPPWGGQSGDSLCTDTLQRQINSYYHCVPMQINYNREGSRVTPFVQLPLCTYTNKLQQGGQSGDSLRTTTIVYLCK